jgi:hypothetical protein
MIDIDRSINIDRYHIDRLMLISAALSGVSAHGMLHGYS